MKLQGLSIVFGLIVIPIILVLAYFIQLQVDTIALQTSYDTKLLDATHDAMMAFEMNTANEDLSSVADSLRTIIDASNNIFMNTLATNLGLSNANKTRIQPYIPAVLYTLYDGYYINSPTQNLQIVANDSGQAIQIDEKTRSNPGDPVEFSTPGLSYESYDGANKCTIYKYVPSDTSYYQIPTTLTGDAQDAFARDFGQLLYEIEREVDPATNEVVIKCVTDVNHPDIIHEKENVLKSYMPYEAKYVNESAGKKIDVTINYTLDNYLTVAGTIKDINGDVYYTKSGYLIQPSLVKNVKCYDNTGAEIGINLLSYNENDAETIIKNWIPSGVKVKLDLEPSTGNVITLESRRPRE